MTGWATAPTRWSVNRLCIGKNKKSSYSKLAISLRGGKRKQTKPREKNKREEKRRKKPIERRRNQQEARGRGGGQVTAATRKGAPGKLLIERANISP